MKARFLALAALVLGLASCQTEPEGLGVNVGGEVDTTITVSLPETTRANSALGAFENVDLNGTNGTDYTVRYIFEVYYGEIGTQKQVLYSDSKSVSFPVRLVPGRDYNFVAWADIVVQPTDDKMNKALPYEDTDVYYETSVLKNITVIDSDSNNEWNAMNEARDAYSGFHNTKGGEKYTGSSSINIRMTRPFAKLRVITTDMVELNNLNISPVSAKVTYSAFSHESFNALDGTYSDATVETIHTFNYADVTSYTDQSGANKVLFTDYFFADASDVVKFELDVYEGDVNNQNATTLIKHNDFKTDIPAQRNYLTTIQGNILTEGNNITVEVEDAFANYDENGNLTDPNYEYATISSEAELLAAIDNGGKYIVISDIDVTGLVASTQAATRTTGTGVTTTINLNGYTITLKTNIEVKPGNTLIINDINENGENGAIVSENDAAIVNNGTLNIEGGEFGENTIVNNGSANVSGGTFEDNAIVNNGSVSVEGNNSGDEDRIIENGTNAVVSNIVYTVEELQAALDEGKVDEIIFGANLVGDATIFQREGVNVNINGDNKKFDGTIYVQGGSRNNGAETLKIANINFETESAKFFIYANYRTEPERYAHNVTIENCTFTSLAGDNSVEVCGASFRQAFNVTIKNCTATNTFYLAWFTGSVGTTIEGCKAINNYEGITVGNGTTSVVKNTEISSSTYGLRVESNHSNYTDTHNVTIENCKLNAFIPVSVRNLTSGKFNLTLNGSNELTRGGLYDIALCSNEYKEGAVAKAPTCEWTISGADNFIVFPREYAVKSVEQIAEALTLKSKVLFAADIKGNVYIAQQENFNVVIDGRGYKFDGTFTIDGKNRNEGAETLTLKNINFYTESTDEMTFISCPGTYNGERERYSHNVTIDGCTFRAASLTEEVGAISAQKTYHLTVKDCEAYNIHSLLQVQSCDNDVTVENVKVENCFSGISVGNTNITNISNANIKTQKYGIRLDGETSRKVTVNVANSNIEAYIPIVARKVITGCNVDVNLTETTLVKNNDDMFDVVFQNNKDYEDGNVTPVAPTGNWKITGADDYIVYPRNYASTPAELKAAYDDANVKTLILSSGKHTIELYTNAVPRESLTIIGTEGTQVEFSNQQVRMPLFKNFTIENCEILHMATKSWGMLVFGGGDKADGVYTVKNCTFNGVGTQGIYINEDVSGATYNVLGCTFNGDFGSEGAISIQNNAGVNITVNVADCKFEDFLGPKIFVHYNNDDMKLNAEGIDVVNGNK